MGERGELRVQHNWISLYRILNLFRLFSISIDLDREFHLLSPILLLLVQRGMHWYTTHSVSTLLGF